MDWPVYSWPTLIMLGIALRIALQLTYGARGPENNDLVFIILNTQSWVLLAAGLMPAVLVSGATVLGVIVIILGVAALIEAVLARRDAMQRSICALLAMVVERQGELGLALLQAGSPRRGLVGRATEGLVCDLEHGMRLEDAVARNRAALPREAIAYATAGTELHDEASALRELGRGEDQALSGLWRTVIDRSVYLVGVVLVMAFVVTFVMVRIVPTFRTIFGDFDIQIPAITELAVGFSRIFVGSIGLMLLLLIPFLLLMAILVAVMYLRENPVLQPLTDRLFLARHRAHVLRILALTAERRHDLSAMLSHLSPVYPSGPIRRALSRAAAKIADGTDWRDALYGARLVTSAECALLGTAQQAGNLPWALRQTARRGERRLAYRWTVLLQIAYPVCILVLGSFVGFFVVAMFYPLVRLIQSMA